MTEFVPEAIEIISGFLVTFAILGIVTVVSEFLRGFLDGLR
jgi:hypothetical protein